MYKTEKVDRDGRPFFLNTDTLSPSAGGPS